MGFFRKEDEFRQGDKHDHKGGAPPPDYVWSNLLHLATGGPSTAPSAAFAMVHLIHTDRIRLLGFPASVYMPLDATIRRLWALGIQEAGGTDVMTYGWKLSGNPWLGMGPQAVPSRKLILAILWTLSTEGWHPLASVDVSRKSRDKDSLVFKNGPRLNRRFFSIFFEGNDKIVLVDPPTPEVAQWFVVTVRTSWPLGVQDENTNGSEAVSQALCYRMKLKGKPWSTDDISQCNQARLMLLSLLSAMDQLGYELVGSVDMSSNRSDSDDAELDSWFFASKFAQSVEQAPEGSFKKSTEGSLKKSSEGNSKKQ